MGFEIYVFVSPLPLRQTMYVLTRAIKELGKVKIADSDRGYILCSWRNVFWNRRKLGRKRKVEFYVERGEASCKVRVNVFTPDLLPITVGVNSARAKLLDTFYDDFLSALFHAAPNLDFGVRLANKNPYILEFSFVGGDETERVWRSKTVGGTSVTGFLLGAALFGDMGALIGSRSGPSRTFETSYDVFAEQRLVRVVYSNGRLCQGYISTSSSAYQEMMVNMK